MLISRKSNGLWTIVWKGFDKTFDEKIAYFDQFKIVCNRIHMFWVANYLFMKRQMYICNLCHMIVGTKNTCANSNFAISISFFLYYSFSVFYFLSKTHLCVVWRSTKDCYIFSRWLNFPYQSILLVNILSGWYKNDNNFLQLRSTIDDVCS